MRCSSGFVKDCVSKLCVEVHTECGGLCRISRGGGPNERRVLNTGCAEIA